MNFLKQKYVILYSTKLSQLYIIIAWCFKLFLQASHVICSTCKLAYCLIKYEWISELNEKRFLITGRPLEGGVQYRISNFRIWKYRDLRRLFEKISEFQTQVSQFRGRYKYRIFNWPISRFQSWISKYRFFKMEYRHYMWQYRVSRFTPSRGILVGQYYWWFCDWISKHCKYVILGKEEC